MVGQIRKPDVLVDDQIEVVNDEGIIRLKVMPALSPFYHSGHRLANYHEIPHFQNIFKIKLVDYLGNEFVASKPRELGDIRPDFRFLADAFIMVRDSALHSRDSEHSMCYFRWPCVGTASTSSTRLYDCWDFDFSRLAAYFGYIFPQTACSGRLTGQLRRHNDAIRDR